MKSLRSLKFILALFLNIAISSIALAASDVPPGTPPDIAKIIAKGQKGQPLTMAEIQKLQKWGAAVAAKLNTPQGNPSQFNHPAANTPQLSNQGIPCDISYSISYDSRSSDGGSVHADANVRAKCMMFPQIGGTDDYFGTALNPAASPTSFRFEPLMAGTAAAKTGSGNFNKVERSKDGSTESRGRYTQTIASLMLVTSGRGELLYPWSGAAGGASEGTATSHDKDGAHTNKIGDPMLLEGLGMFAAEANAKSPAQPGQPCPVPVMTFKLSQVKSAIASGKTATIAGSEGFSFKRGDETFTGQQTLTIIMRPKPLELLIEPADAVAYKKWVPEPDAQDIGADAAKFFGDPKPISFHAVMHDPAKPAAAKSGGLTQPNTPDRSRIDLYLKDVADQAGICMNYPSHAEAKKSVFFPKDQPDDIEWIDEQHVRTKSPAAFDATVNVAARDTGAYGRISARCEAFGIDSKSALDESIPYVSLPLDDNGNHVADQWEKDNSLWDRSLGADSDEENDPSTWKTNGDGLAFYEEYRGFLVDNADHKEEFKRLLPSHRKLFLFLAQKDRGLHEAGAEIYSHATGVEIVYLHDTARLKPMGDNMYPRWINFNATSSTSMKQACVWIDDFTAKNPGFLRGMDSNADAKPHCPADDAVVIISRDACTNQIESWAKEFPPFVAKDKIYKSWPLASASTGIPLDGLGDYITQHAPELVNKLIVFCTMHELGHATGGRHHGLDDYLVVPGPLTDEQNGALQSKYYGGGDETCPMRYWHYPIDQSTTLSFISGKWDLTNALDGTPWKFCSEELKNMRIKP